MLSQLMETETGPEQLKKKKLDPVRYKVSKKLEGEPLLSPGSNR